MSPPIFDIPFSSWESKPVFGEPAYGYFNILVEAEFHTSARVYAQEIEMNGRDLVPEEILARILLLPLADEHKESLRRWTPIQDGRYIHVSGQTLRRKQVSFETRRFCRACLAESARHRTWWDIFQFHVCPFHSLELEVTTANGRPLGWWWPSFEFCPDGTDLGRPAPLREDVDGFEHYVLQRLGACVGVARPLLDDLPLHEVIDVCGVVGRFLGNPLLRRSPRYRKGDCREGFKTLRGTAEEFENTAERWFVSQVPETDKMNGYGNALGWLYESPRATVWAQSSLWPTIDIGLRRAFARVGRVGRGYQGSRDLPHAYLTMKEVAARLGRPSEGLRSIAKQLGIGDHKPGQTSWSPFSLSEVDQLSAAVDDMISTRQAGELLSCAQVCVRRLIEHGTLTGFTKTMLFGKEGKGAVVRKTEVMSLLARIEAVSGREPTVFSRGFSYHVRKTGLTEGELLDAVLRGDAPLAGVDASARGIRSWRFATPVESFQMAIPVEVPKDEITVLDAEVASGFSSTEFASIVQAGLLGEVVMRGRAQSLKRKAFEAFTAKYVNARLFMDRFGGRKRHMRKTLDAIHVRRQFEHVSTAVYIVKRDDLTSVIGPLDGHCEPPIWQVFRKKLKDSCPPFVVPESFTRGSARGYLSSRMTFLEFKFEQDAVIVSKTFTDKSPREWRAFKNLEDAIREDLSTFTWTAEPDGTIRAEFRVASKADIPVVVPGLASFLSRFRNRSRLPQ